MSFDPNGLRAYYESLGDDELARVADGGVADFEPDAWRIVEAEFRRRRLPVPDGMEKARERQAAADADIEVEVPVVANDEESLKKEMAKAIAMENRGALFFLIGAAVTIGTWMTASPGETYAVAYGALIYGVYAISNGRSRRNKVKKLRQQHVIA